MARGFRRRKARYVARLDRDERSLLLVLFEQATSIVEPDEGMAGSLEPSGDEFLDLMRGAGMSSLGAAPAEDIAAPGEPSDPALARLVPAGHRDDPSIAAEFRHLTAQSVRAAKTARLQTARRVLGESASSGDELSLSAEEADSMLAALTDVRLILADRLGLESEEDVEAMEGFDDDDPRSALAAYYDFLTWLQETLAEALLRP